MRTYASLGIVGLTIVFATGCAMAPVVEARDAAPAADATVAAEFNNLYSVDDEVYFGGYPTEAGLGRMREQGVTTVISLKTPQQVREARGFDEPSAAAAMGLDLVVIPVSADSFSPRDVDAFASAFEAAEGPVLLHCGSSNTAGAMWAAYLHKQGIDRERALEVGRSAGLKADFMVEAAERVIDEQSAAGE